MAHLGRPPVQVVLSDELRTELTRRVRAATSTQRDACRARVILACAEGGSAKAVAACVGVSSRAVERWRGRFLRKGGSTGSLICLARDTCPSSERTRLELIAVACEPERRTTEELAAEAVTRGIVESIGWSSYQRILSKVDLRPHLVEGWIRSVDRFASALAALDRGRRHRKKPNQSARLSDSAR